MKGAKTDPRTVSARKDLHAVVGNFFAEQLPQMGPVTREPFVNAVIALLDEYCPPASSIRPISSTGCLPCRMPPI